jgi:hypothetical protein
MSFEPYPSSERGLIGPQLLKTAEEKAEQLRKVYSIDLGPFMDPQVYGKEAVIEDLKKVLTAEKKFATDVSKSDLEAKRLSEVFEMYFVDAANKQKWFGNETNIMRTTRFDDYFNAVDAIAEFQDGNDKFGHLALSTDLTFGYDSSLRKIEDVLRAIDNGTMARLRYFHSDAMGYTGQLRDIPKTILGMDQENLPEFVRLWTHQSDSPEIKPYRDLMLTQLNDQLGFLTAYADKRHGESTIRSKYARAHTIVGNFWKNQNIDRYTIPKDTITEHLKNM